MCDLPLSMHLNANAVINFEFDVLPSQHSDSKLWPWWLTLYIHISADPCKYLRILSHTNTKHKNTNNNAAHWTNYDSKHYSDMVYADIVDIFQKYFHYAARSPS